MPHFLACIRPDHPTPSLLFGQIITELHRSRHDREFAVDFPDYDLKRRAGQLGLTLAVHTNEGADSEYFRQIVESKFGDAVDCLTGAMAPGEYRIVKGLRPLKNRAYAKELTLAHLRAKGVKHIDESLVKKREFYDLPYVLISSKGNGKVYPRFVQVETVRTPVEVADGKGFSTLGFSMGAALPLVRK
jgi:hypothetical protein